MPFPIQPHPSPKSKPAKFLAIEGLRGWLAGAVVLTHLCYMAGFQMPWLSDHLRTIGLPSVRIFLIISGFVIMHITLEKRPAYGPYLLERWFRIFPLFTIACLAGFFTDQMLASTLVKNDFSDREFAKLMSDIVASEHLYLPYHVIAHVSMLHALIPNSILPFSEYAFSMPAWVISLQFQFYITAPMLLLILRDKRQFLLPLAAIFVMLWFIFQHFGGTIQPGALALSAPYFVVGIISRVILGRIEIQRKLDVAVVLAIVIWTISELRPFAIWLVVFSGLSIDRFSNLSRLERCYLLLLENRFILYCGTRSYAIYLTHFPTISIMAWLLVAPGMLVLTCASLPLIVIVSEIAYRWIELPGIALGKNLGTAWQGETGQGMARLGEAGRGPAWLGSAWQGEAFNSRRQTKERIE